MHPSDPQENFLLSTPAVSLSVSHLQPSQLPLYLFKSPTASGPNQINSNMDYKTDSSLFQTSQLKENSGSPLSKPSAQSVDQPVKMIKHGFIKRPWTPEEDQKLAAYVMKEGPGKWKQAASLIFGRSGKQCRERWLNNLNPDVRKGNWTAVEDQLIIELFQKYGSKWTQIARFIPGRTENSIKNRFYCALRKPATAMRNKANSKSSNFIKTEEQSDCIPKCEASTLSNSESEQEYSPKLGTNSFAIAPVKEESTSQENEQQVVIREKQEPIQGEGEPLYGKYEENEKLQPDRKVLCMLNSTDIQETNFNTDAHGLKKQWESRFLKFSPQDHSLNTNFTNYTNSKFGSLQNSQGLISQFDIVPQRTLGLFDQNLFDLTGVSKVNSVNEVSQLTRHHFLLHNLLFEQANNQATSYNYVQTHSFPVSQSQRLTNNLLKSQEQITKPEATLYHQYPQYSTEASLPMTLSFSSPETNEESPLTTPESLNREQLSERNQALPNFAKQMDLKDANLNFGIQIRHEEHYANRKFNESMDYLIKTMNNKIARASLLYSDYLKQIKERTNNYSQEAQEDLSALFHQVYVLERWINRAKADLQGLLSVSHRQKNLLFESFMPQEGIEASINKKRLSDQENFSDHLIKKRR